ncbi:MAG: quinolinate synthase NadA [Candidatus Hydrogenedentota bacterium]
MTTALHDKFARLGLESLYSEEACRELEAEFASIRALKKEHNAILLAHNYQRPEIFEVADFVGDSLELARRAVDVESDAIIFCGVHFMAETAKILNPSRKVILPNLNAGCSLAEAADAEAVVARAEELRRTYPDLAIVSYVNTTAAVKAVTDVCVTSGNAVRIVNSLPNSAVLFIPYKNLAAYVQENTSKKIIPWEGDCYVHHQMKPSDILDVKKNFPDAKIMAHPECRTDVLGIADAVLSTAGMIRYAKESPATEFIVVTECGLSDRLLMEVPEKKFYKSCNLCRYMKMITLADTKRSLQRMAPEITLPADIIEKASGSILRMLELSA